MRWTVIVSDLSVVLEHRLYLCNVIIIIQFTPKFILLCFNTPTFTHEYSEDRNIYLSLDHRWIGDEEERYLSNRSMYFETD